MTSTFFGIESMRRAIQTHRTVMDVIGHNVANASTPGYSRQVVKLEATSPYAYPGMNNSGGVGQIGTGVIATTVERIRDVFVDGQLRLGTSNQAQLAAEQEALERIEAAFMEPSTTEGISDALTDFYDAWQTLAQTPDKTAARQNVISTAQNLVSVINQIDQSLRDIRSDLNSQIREDVTEVNRILKEVADLNREIRKVVTSGKQPNDLMDKRDLLIDELSQYIDVKVSETESQQVALHVGSRQLLWNDSYNELEDDVAWDHPSQATQTPGFSDVTMSDFNKLGDFSRGELRGLLNARDEYTPEVFTKFNEMVQTIVDEINNASSASFGIQSFVQDLGLTTTSDIVISPPAFGVGDNVVGLNQIKNINVGDILRIEEPDAVGDDGITVKVTSISGTNVYFEQVDTLSKSASSGAATALYQVSTGARVYKIDSPKYNFFELQQTLPSSYVGDNVPEYYTRMTSTVTLDENITLNTTLRDIENMYGFTNAVNGRSISLDDMANSVGMSDGMTLGQFIQRINEVRPKTNEGEEMNLQFDEANHRLILSGSGQLSLSELGGTDGSDLNLFRIFGFEGYHMTGFSLTEGTTLTSASLNDIGVSDGWFMVDGVTLQAQSGLSIKDNITAWNSALAASDSTSNKTEFMFDPVERRIKIVSSHQFSVRDAQQPFPTTPPFTQSNFLTQMGFRDADGELAFSVEQQTASITSSDIGARLKVNSTLADNVNLIATSRNATGAPGDNSAALAIAASRTILSMDNTATGITINPNSTIEEYYDNMVASLGTEAQRVEVDGEVVQKFLDYYEQRREEVSGVSLDEEMTKMIEAQHAFNAASRMINVVDTMLDKIINGMGLAGR